MTLISKGLIETLNSVLIHTFDKQLLVVKRFKHLAGSYMYIKRKLYNAFILSAFNYCSDVWHFCRKCSKRKLEQSNKQALRTVLNSNGDYER